MTDVEAKRTELLNHYAKKTPVEFWQFDGFTGVKADSLVCPDADSDACFSSGTWELRNDNVPVRVQIRKGVPATIARRLLEKLLVWYAQDVDALADVDSKLAAAQKKLDDATMVYRQAQAEYVVEAKPLKEIRENILCNLE